MMQTRNLVLVTPPAAEPLTAAEVWEHLRVDLTGSPAAPADASLIAALIKAVRQHLDGRDGWLGRALVPQTWDLKLRAFPAACRGNPDGAVILPLPPLISVDQIIYIDSDGASQTLASSLYTVSGVDGFGRGRVEPSYGNAWPATRDVPEAVAVRFTAGYASGNSPEDGSAVPEAIGQAMLLMIGHLYANREAVNVGNIVTELPLGASALLAPYRTGWF